MMLSWLEAYYEALEFFYWEPQHMRLKKPAAEELEALEAIAKRASRSDQVMAHLRKMEVTLNQNIRQFFCLAPGSLLTHFFQDIYSRPANFVGEFRLYGREVDSELDLRNFTQPDFLFVSKQSVVSIEMKVRAQSSIDQILKYALLGLAVEVTQNEQKQHYHLLLGPASLSNQFKEQFKSVDALKNTLAEKKGNLDEFLRYKPKWRVGREDRLRTIIENMHIEFWNYERLCDFLRGARPLDSDSSAGAEVYRKLIDGLVGELEFRKLVPAA